MPSGLGFENKATPPSSNFLDAELKRLSKLAKANPKNPEVHLALGITHFRANSPVRGLKHLKKAHTLVPKVEKYLGALCEALFLRTKDYREAALYFKKWSVIRPDLAILHINRAKCYIKLGQSDATFEALEKAEAIDSSHPEFKPTRANAYAKIGNEEFALRDFEVAYAETGDPKIVTALLEIPGYKPDVAKLDEMKSRFRNAQEQRVIIAVYSSLGIAYEKIGEYGKAFECFEIANERPSQNIDRQAHLAGFENAKKAFSKEFLNSGKIEGHSSAQPVFVVGMPRSGTTLVESILAGHPEIIDNGELPFLHGFLLSNGLYKTPEGQGKDFAEFLQQASAKEFKALGQAYLDQPAFQKNDKRYQVDKLPHNFMAVGLIHLIFPNAKLVWCRRNPIDTALSCYKTSFSDFHDYATDLSFLGEYYRAYEDLMKHWQDALPEKMLEIFYEDTVANTEFVARNMIDFLGLEWDERCLDHTASKETVRTASQWQVRQPIYRSSVAKWKHYEEQLQPMIRNMGSIVEQYDGKRVALTK